MHTIVPTSIRKGPRQLNLPGLPARRLPVLSEGREVCAGKTARDATGQRCGKVALECNPRSLESTPAVNNRAGFNLDIRALSQGEAAAG
jgi:hypothetical protein